MATPAKRRRQLQRETDSQFSSSSNTTSSGDVDFAGRRLNAAVELSEEAGVLPRPPLLCVTGRHNTVLEFHESMFTGLENNSDVSDDEEQVDRPDKKAKTSLDAKTLQVLQGSFKELPPRPTCTVRIFLSSTFSDFKAERNILPRLAYPKLQQYCSQRGLDFQVVDMRWGVTDDVINDHQVSQLCINEIVTCQQISCGPNFVALLGNRYGFQPFPAKIGYEEFDILASIAKETKVKYSELLTEWFVKDENSVPPEYILQPIPSKLKHYNDVSEENSDKRDEDRKKWEEISNKLQEVLRTAAAIAKERNLITAEREHTYHISVTEEEVVQGVFCSDNPSDKVLCYQRSLEGLVNEDIDAEAPKYIDLNEEMKVDERRQELRQKLINEKLPRCIREENIKTYQVPWKKKALEKAQDDYREYLCKFCDDFVDGMKNLIDSNMKSIEDQRKGEVEGLYEEVLHHSQFAKSKCELFCGREEEIKAVKDYLLTKADDSQTKTKERHPMVVHARSGYGKTAFMAYISSHVQEWMGDDAVLILRFLGTSPSSSTVITLLRSIIQQICIVYGFKIPPEENLEMFSEVRRCMLSALKNTRTGMKDRPLVLVLDAVDQLQASYGAHEFLWLVRTLPSNVYIIVSMLSERFQLVENVKTRLGEDTKYLELRMLPESTGAEIIQCYLETHNRVVTADQNKLIMSAFEQNRQALFLRLILDSARTWNSYTQMDTVHLATTVHEAITRLYVDLEVTYGKVFVQNALGYLTCGRGGLSPLEMEDILSCDNACLSEVYQYHDPPLEGIIRIPSLLWSRVQHALQEYLTERQVDGKSVLAWYHRQFHEAAEKRFHRPNPRRQELHFALSELFMQEDGITKTVILHHRKGKVIENADRCVTPQPLNVRNKRKLHALPYHLLHSGRVEPLKKNCLLNFEFLLTKLKALNIGAFFNEYRDLADSELLKEEEDIQLLCDLLQMCYNALTYDPNLFAFHVKESLKLCSQGHDLLEKLVQDAKNWLETSNIPLLLPANELKIEPADSPLKFSILIGYDGVLSNDEEYMVCCWRETLSNIFKVNCINLKTKDIVASVTTEKPTPVAVTKDDRRFIFGEATTMRICEISSGDQVNRFTHLSKQYEKVTVRCITLSADGKLAAVAIRCGKPKDLAEEKSKKKNAWRQTTHIALINLEECETVKEVEYTGRKHPEKIYFHSNDSEIMTSAKDKLITYQLPDLTAQQVKVNYEINSHAQKMIQNKRLLVSGVVSDKIAKVCLYHCSDRTLDYSKNVHPSEQDKVKVFALCTNGEGSVILVGTQVERPTVYEESVCLWDRSTDKYSFIRLTHQPYKSPSSMAVMPDWSYALVGWSNGYLAVLDLQNLNEIWAYQAHAHAVYNITFLDFGRQYITMSQDHSLKLWDSKRQLKKCLAQYDTSKKIDVEQPDKEQFLNENEESLDIDTARGYVVTAISDHMKGPQFWHMADGKLDTEVTERFTAIYTESLRNHNPEPNPTTGKAESLKDPASGKTHGSIKILPEDILIYERKRRDFMAIWTFDIKDLKNPVLLGHYEQRMAFFRAISPKNEINQRRLLVVRDGELDVLSFPQLETQHVMEIPKVTDEVQNIYTNGGKKKLLYYKVGCTVDGKYLIIANTALGTRVNNNPTGSGKDYSLSKFCDLVNLEEGKYVERLALSKYVPWTLMEDGCYFLVDVKEEGLGLYSPSKLTTLKKHVVTSKVLIDSDKFLSSDRKLGFELKDHDIKVWQLETMKRLHILSGHLYDVTSLSVSNDNEYLATGSYDNTVRIWSLSAGTQLCMFHTYGAIDKVVLTPSLSNVVLQCYAAPQRKRGLILQIQNLL